MEEEKIKFMLESSGHLFTESKRWVGSKWEEAFFIGLRKKFGDSAFENFPESIFRAENAEPKFVDNQTDRPKLRSEGGVVFANHPYGGIDSGIVLEALKDEAGHIRPDLKILVHAKNYPVWSEYFGEQHFVPATRDPGKAPKIFNQAAELVNRGGLFLIFPENLEKTLAGKPMEFEAGLAYLLQRIEDNKMAYTFSINPNDLAGAASLKMSRVAMKGSMAIEALMGKPTTIPRLGSKRVLRVGERYSQCGEWKAVMAKAGQGRFDQSQALKDHFVEIHKDNL